MLRLVLLPVLIELVLGRPGAKTALPPLTAASELYIGMAEAPLRTLIELAQGRPGAKTTMPPLTAASEL